MKKNEYGFAHSAIIGVIVLVFVAGAFVYVSNSDKPKTVSRETTETESDLVSPLPANILPVDKIKELAAAEAPNVELTSVELEQEHGVYIYKIKLANGTVLFLNAQTGAKVTHDAGENEVEEGTIPAGFVTAITFDKAREIALSQKPGGVISKIELENEEGKIVYSVRFSDDARIDIDASSGVIVRSRPAETTTTPSSSTTSSNSGSDSGSGSDSSDDDSSHSGSGSSGSDSGHDDNDD